MRRNQNRKGTPMKTMLACLLFLFACGGTDDSAGTTAGTPEPESTCLAACHQLQRDCGEAWSVFPDCECSDAASHGCAETYQAVLDCPLANDCAIEACEAEKDADLACALEGQ
jgi:hypothetical protein